VSIKIASIPVIENNSEILTVLYRDGLINVKMQNPFETNPNCRSQLVPRRITVHAYHPGRPILMKYLLSFAALLIVPLASCTLEPPAKKIPVRIAAVTGESIKVQVRSSDGLITSLIHVDSGNDFFDEQPDSLDSPVFGVEVYDELESVLYSDLSDSTFISNFSEGENEVSFSKQFKNAPFLLNQNISRHEHGIFLHCRATCEDSETPVRSVRFTYLIPVPTGYLFWAPGMDDPLVLDGENAVRYRYGCGELSDKATGLPLVSLWKPGAQGLTVAVPLEIKTVRVSFSIEPSVHSRPPAGSFPTSKDFNYLRVTFDLVGIGPGRALETGLWLYGHQDDWRPSLNIFSDRYREVFAALPRAHELAGVLADVEPNGADPAAVRRMLRMDAGLARINWNFQRYGQWIPPQALRFSDFTWTCQLAPEKFGDISVQQVRFLIDALRIAKLEPVLYAAYNQHCDRELAESNFSADIARDELGRPLIGERGHLLMHAAQTSPFGRQILQQQRQMIELYPEAVGFFFDDLPVAAVDFAHDDSLTLIHNRPAANLGDTFGRLGPLLTKMVHNAGKLVLASPPSTVSAGAGVDIFCLESAGRLNLGTMAMVCLNRPAVSFLPAGAAQDAQEMEFQLQRQLIWGVIPSAGQLQANLEVSRAYRALYLSLKGRQWVLEPHALVLPEGIRGQIFRVPSADRPGRRDILVTAVRPGVLLADQSLRPGVTVRVRVPEAEYLVRAVWTAAASPARPIPLRPVFQEGEITVELPPFGPSGVLRLSRR